MKRYTRYGTAVGLTGEEGNHPVSMVTCHTEGQGTSCSLQCVFESSRKYPSFNSPKKYHEFFSILKLPYHYVSRSVCVHVLFQNAQKGM